MLTIQHHIEEGKEASGTPNPDDSNPESLTSQGKKHNGDLVAGS